MVAPSSCHGYRRGHRYVVPLLLGLRLLISPVNAHLRLYASRSVIASRVCVRLVEQSSSDYCPIRVDQIAPKVDPFQVVRKLLLPKVENELCFHSCSVYEFQNP